MHMLSQQPFDRAGPERRVLVVDDEPRFRRALTRCLERAGFEIWEADDAEGALRLLAEEYIDVVVTDVCLPRGSGLDLLTSLRETHDDVPVIVTSGMADAETEAEATRLQAFRYIQKPLEPRVFTEAVTRACSLRRLAGVAQTQGGGRRVEYHADPEGFRLAFEEALRTLTVYHQPIVDRDGGIFGYEAFLRPFSTVFPSPMDLLRAARQLDQVVRLEFASQELAKAPFDDNSEALLFLNVLPELIADETARASLPSMDRAERVVLELNERVDPKVIASIRGGISELRDWGFRVALDDLGSGSASLAALVDVEPDVVKLDGTLTDGLYSSPSRQRVVRAIIEMCHDLDIITVAERIERTEEYEILRRMGCNHFQGYLFGAPQALARAK